MTEKALGLFLTTLGKQGDIKPLAGSTGSVRRADLTKRASTHKLRHSFATHLLNHARLSCIRTFFIF